MEAVTEVDTFSEVDDAFYEGRLHSRTAFRYRFYADAQDIDDYLQGWMRFYNFERPHRGYRTKGRRPAEIFYADRPDLLEMKGWDPGHFAR